ncbi:hypothetical protein EEAAV_10180 [Rahnella aceris]|nr:hypothetical protein SRABI106_03607 [Rahnella aquatilis]
MADNKVSYISDFTQKNKTPDGGNGGGDDMLERVKALEEKMTSMITDIAILKETVATKESLHKELNAQTWKIVVAIIVVVIMALLSKYFLK